MVECLVVWKERGNDGEKRGEITGEKRAQQLLQEPPLSLDPMRNLYTGRRIRNTLEHKVYRLWLY